MEKLPKGFKEKWIAALRSGDYKQTDGELYNEAEDAFCCLGVACHIVGIRKSTIEGMPTIDKDIRVKKKSLIPSIIKGASHDKASDYSPLVGKLTKFNDNGKSFKWIASYIERYL